MSSKISLIIPVFNECDEIENFFNDLKKCNFNLMNEVIFVDDLADACVYFMNKKIKENIVNIGTGKDYKIIDYVNFISKAILNRKIRVKFDKTKPNGTPRKVLDISLAKKHGWVAKTDLIEAIKKTYIAFKKENK